MEKVLIGWAEESLVPEKKVSLAGQFYERISDHVETEISATAMAIEGGDQKAIIISCDLTNISADLGKMIRERFAKLTDEIDPKYIIFGATHTHTSIKYGSTTGGFSPAVKILKEIIENEEQLKEVTV